MSLSGEGPIKQTLQVMQGQYFRGRGSGSDTLLSKIMLQ